MKIGIIGDQHFKDNLSYADYIDDRRVAEKKEILDFIVDSFKDCKHVVFMGDNFNSKNNSSEVNREFIEFLERFGTKELYIISGNHEKKGDGKTAIDFIGEIKKTNWHIFTKPNSIEIEEMKIDFLPYMLNSELEETTHEDATKKIVKELKGGDIMFTHHALTGTTFNGMKSELLREIVLPREKLEKKYKIIIAGHIHQPQNVGNTLVTGSLFTSEVNEIEKFIYKIDDKLELEKFKVPAREIHKIENPTETQLKKIPSNSIVKVIVKDKKIDVTKVEKNLKRFDAQLLIEDYPSTRKKMKIEKGAFDFSIEALLKLYSESKKVDYQKLKKGLELIND